MSAMVNFPKAECDEAVLTHKQGVTAGSLLAARGRDGFDSKDPHRYLTNGLVSRVNILTQAISICFGELGLVGSL